MAVEEVVDKIIAELELFDAADSDDGGIADLLQIEAVYFGDPGVIPVNSYPCFTVQPVRDSPDKETTSYEVRNIQVLLTLLIDAREYFDADVLEASGDRKMVEVMERVRRWFRRDSNRSLDGLTGVREVAVTTTDYNMQVRGGVVAKAAQVTLLVNQQKPRQA